MKDLIQSRSELWNRQGQINPKHLKAGSVKDKIEVQIDERTTIFVKPGTNIEAVRVKYLKHIYGFHWMDKSGNVNHK